MISKYQFQEEKAPDAFIYFPWGKTLSGRWPLCWRDAQGEIWGEFGEKYVCHHTDIKWYLWRMIKAVIV